jgi:hypothetical protein
VAATGLDQLKRNFREALAEDFARSRLPSQIDTAMSMLASLQVSMAPGPPQMSLPADGGTDVAKRESNPSEYFAAAAPQNRIGAEVLQSRQVATKLSACFAALPFYRLSGATASAFGAATEPSSTYTEKNPGAGIGRV